MPKITDDLRPKRWAIPRHYVWLLPGLCFVTLSCIGNFLHPVGDGKPQDWDQSRGPTIPHDDFPADCSICHVGDAWNEIRDDFVFDHAKETGVALRGAHATAQCLRCHNDRGPAGIFAKRGCAGCHEDLHRGQLGKDCRLCHSENDWLPHGEIAMHNRTRFPLVGAHTAVACFRCHLGAQVGNFSRADAKCESCHQQDFKRAKNPNHLALGWTRNCQKCHSPTVWKGQGFVHSQFPLLGAHQAVNCDACHQNGQFGGLSRVCSSCHLSEYQAAANPNHAAMSFPTTCQSCHNTVAWQGVSGQGGNFNHSGMTGNCSTCHLADYNATTNPNHTAGGFPTNCESCHNTNAWNGAAFNHSGMTGNCSTCHLADYNGTTNPNHTAGGFPTNCESCHNTNAWNGAAFNHSGMTGNCSTCHLADYNGTTNPNHTSGGFPKNCESCHNTNAWNGAAFNHSGMTGNCSTCHLADYNGTTNPNHTSGGFPKNCESCHNTNAWNGAAFNHSGMTGNCSTCHLADYNGTTNPNHASAGFPTNCGTCHHNTNAWNGATFNHAFRINGGPHGSLSCQDCHRLPTNYSMVSCVHCHAHTQSRMADKHSGKAGYSWNSSSCVSCHPTGRG